MGLTGTLHAIFIDSPFVERHDTYSTCEENYIQNKEVSCSKKIISYKEKIKYKDSDRENVIILAFECFVWKNVIEWLKIF